MITEQNHDGKLGLLLLGRYRIIRKLGEGGMGAVYEGKHELIGKRLAIKCLHPQFVTNREVVERFYREANAATAVGNEHIIEVTDLGTFDDGSPFIVMEYLEGQELAKLIQQEGGLPVARMMHIAEQVCNALSAAHARGIVHRDMKPENIFLIQRGTDPDFVKVLDFGISKVHESNEALGHGLTKTGAALGTPYYMAPEQAQAARDLDHRADVYAVGVILYEGLSGHLPFDADSYPALMLKIMSERPAPIRVFRTDVPDALEQVVQKAMARDRNERFQSIEALAAALKPFGLMTTLAPQRTGAHGALPSTTQATPFVSVSKVPEPVKNSARPPQSTLPPIKTSHKWAAIAAAAAIAITGVFLGMRGTSPAAPPEPLAVDSAVNATAEQAKTTAASQIAQALPPPIAEIKPTEVQIQISASPSDAQIYIGEVQFPNPMVAFRPRSLDPIRIRVQAPGHETQEQLAIFDQNRQISFNLSPGRGIKRLASAAPKAVPAAVVAAPVKAVPPTVPVAAPPATEKPDGVYRGPSGKIRDNF